MSVSRVIPALAQSHTQHIQPNIRMLQRLQRSARRLAILAADCALQHTRQDFSHTSSVPKVSTREIPGISL